MMMDFINMRGRIWDRRNGYVRKQDMREVPISAAHTIAEAYGADQVIIITRKCGDGPDRGEAVTTYGASREHCDIAGQIGDFLKFKVMQWADCGLDKTLATPPPGAAS